MSTSIVAFPTNRLREELEVHRVELRNVEGVHEPELSETVALEPLGVAVEGLCRAGRCGFEACRRRVVGRCRGAIRGAGSREQSNDYQDCCRRTLATQADSIPAILTRPTAGVPPREAYSGRALGVRRFLDRERWSRWAGPTTPRSWCPSCLGGSCSRSSRSPGKGISLDPWRGR